MQFSFQNGTDTPDTLRAIFKPHLHHMSRYVLYVMLSYRLGLSEKQKKEFTNEVISNAEDTPEL